MGEDGDIDCVQVLSAPLSILRGKDLFAAPARVQVGGSPWRCGLARGFPARDLCIPWPKDLVHLIGHRTFGRELKSGCKSGQGIWDRRGHWRGGGPVHQGEEEECWGQFGCVFSTCMKPGSSFCT